MAFKKIEPALWKPEKEGDEITGVLIKKDYGVGEYESTLYSVETEAGKFVNFFGGKVLDGKMAYVKDGDRIKVIFKGKVKKKYNNYEVYIDDEKQEEKEEEKSEEERKGVFSS